MKSVAERLALLRPTIPEPVQIIAVTKTVPTSLMREAYDAGLRNFGESRVQEAFQKQQELADLKDIVWHFIGHLQRNKVKAALQQFQYLHSVDNLALAQRINLLARDLQKQPQVYLQVKLRHDPSKFGWSREALFQDLLALQQCHHLAFRGLMTILPLGLSDLECLQVFQETAAIAQEIRQHPSTPLPLQDLSMGMSQDYPLAIQAGATSIRLGSILFGDRI